MTREKLDDFTTIVFALTFCSVGVMSCVKLLYRIFKMLFLNE